jgi:hypothetical protein
VDALESDNPAEGGPAPVIGEKGEDEERERDLGVAVTFDVSDTFQCPNCGGFLLTGKCLSFSCSSLPLCGQFGRAGVT